MARGDIETQDPSGEPARFLVVEDEPAVARRMARALEAIGRVATASTVDESEALLAQPGRWTAFFIDVKLPDGSGLELLARARPRYPGVRAMVLTGLTRPEAINAAYDLGAAYVVKPVELARVVRFAETAASASASLATTTRAWAARYGLSEAEADLALRAARGEPREAIAAARNASSLTVKNQISSLLRKTGDESLHGAVERLLRDALANLGGG